MNISHNMQAARTRWIHLGVAAIGIMVLSWAVALGLATPARVSLPEARRATDALAAALARYENHKLAEIERNEAAATGKRPALLAARQRYENHKLAEIERNEAAATGKRPALLAARQRYEDFKQAQTERIVDEPAYRTSNVLDAYARYVMFKLQQIVQTQ
jgi:hypothetical protein